MITNEWVIFFAQIAGIQYHPANPPETRMSLEDCAKVADNMQKIMEERYANLGRRNSSSRQLYVR